MNDIANLSTDQSQRNELKNYFQQLFNFLSCSGEDCMNPMQVLASFAQIAFGLSAAWIAYQQWLLNHNKAKFELYEKRYEAYQHLQNFLGSVVQSGKVETPSLLSFRWKFEENYFLFRENIHQYVEKIYAKSLEFRRFDIDLWGVSALPVGPERNIIVDKQDEVLRWLIDQRDHSKKIFEKYLRIK